MDYYALNSFLLENSILTPEMYDLLKTELDQRIYYFGNHFKSPFEKFNQNFQKESLKTRIQEYYLLYQEILSKRKDDTNETIISSAYFTVNEKLKENKYTIYKPPWIFTRETIPDFTLYQKIKAFKNKMARTSFYELCSSEFSRNIENITQNLMKVYSKSSALIVSNDVSFFDNLSIKIMKKLEKPSFIFLHGLPGRYNKIDENRSDYLIVWGNKIKENYVKVGFNPNKIFVSGHPNYQKLNSENLRNSLGDILVLTKSMNGGQASDKIRLPDRGNSILYLYKMQKTLKKLGVQKVRFRPHPSENPAWYYQHIDRSFFILDQSPLDQALKKSSLVIGPTSTVFLEAIYQGVNYQVFEPSEYSLDYSYFEPIPPFDGSDSKVPVAKNEDELFVQITEKKCVDSKVFYEYIKTPFDISFITDILKKR